MSGHDTDKDSSIEHLSASTLFARVGPAIHVNMPTHDQGVPLHDHDFLEIAVVIDGHALHRTIHGEQPIHPGDVLVLHPGQWHAYEQCRGLRVVNVLLGAELFTVELAWIRSDPHLSRLLPQRGKSHGGQGVMTFHLDKQQLIAVRNELDILRTIQQTDDPMQARPAIIGRLLCILHQLSTSLMLLDTDRMRAATQPDAAISASIQRMEDRLNHPWGLVELAHGARLNRSYFVRLFRRHTGHSPMAWLTRRRAEKAAVLLLTTDQPIAAIARAVGWQDANYFARRFRAVFGLSARAYRAQLPCPPLIKTDAADWIQW